jgi:hypothetical protein
MKVFGKTLPLPHLKRENVDAFVGGIVGLASITVSIADLLGLLGGTLASRLPALTLLLVALVSMYLVFERHGNFEDAKKAIEETDRHVREQFHNVRAEHAQLSATIRHIDSFFGAAASGDRFAQLRMIYAARELGKLGNDRTIMLGRESIFPAWLDCVNASHSFDAFNYVTPEEVWRSGWFEDVSHAAQVGRLLQGATIRRVFMVDTEAERLLLEPLMDRQASVGIEVSWVLSQDVLCLPYVAEYLERLGTRDLMLFDGQLIFRVFLNDERSMMSCSISKDGQMVDLVRNVVGSALRVSQKWSPARNSKSKRGNSK